MALIENLDGIKIRIFPDDHNPPHVHVFCDSDAVSIDIKTLRVSGTLNTRILKKIVDWVEQNQDNLLERWEKLNGLP